MLLGASRGPPCDSVASCILCAVSWRNRWWNITFHVMPNNEIRWQADTRSSRWIVFRSGTDLMSPLILFFSPVRQRHWSLFSTYWRYTNKIIIIIIIILVEATSSTDQKAQGSVVSNRIGMKFGRKLRSSSKYSTYRLTESEFRWWWWWWWSDVTLSWWRPLRHFTQQSAATWWAKNETSAGANGAASASSWSIVHSYLLAYIGACVLSKWQTVRSVAFSLYLEVTAGDFNHLQCAKLHYVSLLLPAPTDNWAPAAKVSCHTVRWQSTQLHQLQDEEAIDWISRWSKAYEK